MNKKILIAGLLVSVMILVPINSASSNISNQTDNKPVNSSNMSNTLYVGGSGPNNYTKIQNAIKNANNGDTVYVYDDSAPYHEIITIDKSIKLIGEDKNTTIIDNHKLGNIIKIIKDGVTIESFTLTNASNIFGHPVFGIKVESNNNEIKNTIISKNHWGISCENYYNNKYTENIIKKNKYGIYIDGGENNLISNNEFISNENGHLKVYHSDLNIINNNILKKGSKYGIDLGSTKDIILTNNILEKCGINFGATFINFSNNIINGKPFIYMMGEANKTIEEAGQIYLKNCNNITIKNSDLSDVSFSIFGSKNSNILIEENIFRNTYKAIEIGAAINFIVKNNYIKDSVDGIRMWDSKDCIIMNNYCNDSYWIDVYDCKNISIVNNTFIKSGWNVYFQYSDHCNVSNNIMYKCGFGILIEIDSKYNTFSKNDIRSCGTSGIRIEGFSNNNRIFHNNFIDNKFNVISLDCKNNWKLNYWDDYSGKDNDNNGIGDTPYNILIGDKDYCPLMKPYEEFNPDAPSAPIIKGPTNGKPGIEYNYTFVTNDPNSDDMYFYITWGDGTYESWIGPYGSGETITLNHTWDVKNVYPIIARAKDSNGLIGPWGILTMSMQRNKALSNSHWFRFLEGFPLLKRLIDI